MLLQYNYLFLNILDYLYICDVVKPTSWFMDDILNYNRIKEMLVKHNKTSKALAEYLKVHEPTVSTWCTNNSQPSVKTLFKIAKFLKIEASELLSPMNSLNKIKK
jgi:putative transcriptional regulator